MSTCIKYTTPVHPTRRGKYQEEELIVEGQYESDNDKEDLIIVETYYMFENYEVGFV